MPTLQYGVLLEPTNGGGDNNWSLIRSRDAAIPSPIEIEEFANFGSGGKTIVTTFIDHRLINGNTVKIITNHTGNNAFNGTYTVADVVSTAPASGNSFEGVYTFTIVRDGGHTACGVGGVRMIGPPVASIDDNAVFAVDTAGNANQSETTYITAPTLAAYLDDKITAMPNLTGIGSVTNALAMTFSGVTLFHDANNADISLEIGTSTTEALSIAVLNGGSNKTAEEIKIMTKTVSGGADHGKISVYIDEVEIFDIDDGGIDMASGKTVAIDGTDIGSVATSVTVAGESTDTSCFPLFVTAETGDLPPKSGSNLQFNSSTGLLTATGFAGTTIGHTSDTDLLTLADGALTLAGTLTVGSSEGGHDVKLFGATAGAYMLWDESADQLVIMGASADATTSTGKLLLATSNPTVDVNDVLGKIEFQAPAETGTDAITVAAAIEAVAMGTFGSTVNATDLVFKTGFSGAATEKFRITDQGALAITSLGVATSVAALGASGDFLTSGGAANPTWTTPEDRFITNDADDAMGGKLTIVKTSGAQLALNYDGGEYTTFTVADDGGLTIATSGTGTLDSTLVLDADGDIEINAAGGDIRFKQGANPLGDFDTNGNLTIPGSFITTSGGMTIRGTGGLLLGTAGNTDPVTMTMITTVGNVAGKPLTLSAGSTVTEGYNLNGGDLILASGGGDGTGTSAMTFSTKVSGTDAVAERMRIHTNGMVGIGVDDPDTTLEIRGDSRIVNTTSTTTNVLEIAAYALTTGNGLNMNIDDSLTGASIKTLINVDYDKSGVTGATQGNYTTGLKINMADAATNNAISLVSMIGAKITIDSANAQGTIQQTGLELSVAVDSVGDAATTAGLITQVMDGGTDILMRSSADAADYCSISTTASGATTIATVDSDDAEAAHLTFDIQGDTIFKGDIADGTSTAVCKIDASASSLFIESGKKIELGNAGEYIVGDGTDLDIVSSNDATVDAGGDILLDAAGDNIILLGSAGLGMQFKQHHSGTWDIENLAQDKDIVIKVNDGGVAKGVISINGAEPYIGFSNAGVGFTRNEATFSTTGVVGSGGSDDTDIDFRTGNKFRLEMTGDIAQMNLIFPAVSGNFLIVCTTNGDHDVTAWKVWESDESAATTTDVMWAGGSVPAFTSSGIDIVSFYWDANEQQAYGVASLAFATP